MNHPASLALSVCVLLAMAPATQATVGCEVKATATNPDSVPLHYGPGADTLVLRHIPLGDIVRHLDQDMAPSKLDGWVWVHHDHTQIAIWQGGITGWVHEDTITNCG